MEQENFYDLSEEVVALFMEIYNTKAFPVNIGFKFIGCAKQKQLVKISKITDEYNYFLGKEILVKVNEDLYDAFDESMREILFEQEIEKITVNPNNGKIKTTKPDLNTFSGLVNKHGIEKVARANQVEEIFNQQKSDKQVDEATTFIV